jgi:hypothetical protein
MKFRTFGKVLAAWLLAVLTATLLGSIVQTQFNLLSIVNLDVAIPLGSWLLTTVQDIFSFGLLYAILAGIALAIGFSVAALLIRRFSWPREFMFMLAGAAALLVLLVTLNAALPMTPIAATRNTLALVLMALAGAPAGWVYSRVRVLS